MDNRRLRGGCCGSNWHRRGRGCWLSWCVGRHVVLLHLEQVGVCCWHTAPANLKTVSGGSDQLDSTRGSRSLSFQIPEVLATDLVVPSLSVSVPSAPDPESSVDRNCTVACAGSRHGVLEHLHGETLPGHAVHVEAGQGVRALPLLLVCRHLDIVHDQGHPAAEDEHPGTNHGG